MSPPTPDQLPLPSAENSQARWFTDQVYSHELSLKAYLRGSFPAVRDVDDVVQESYLRIWKARAVEPIESAKAFLFRVARNVALNLVRRNRNSPIDAIADLSILPVLEERPGAVEAISTDEKLRLLAEAIAALPPKCREVVMLCKLKGFTHRQAADRLGLAEKTVDEHVFRGFQRLDLELRKRGIDRHFV